MPSEITGMLSLIGTLVLMVATFVGAYFVSKIVAGQYQNTSDTGKNGIKIIEKRLIGKDQSILIVNVGGKVLLLGATPQSIQKLDELDDFCIMKEEKNQQQTQSFQTILKKIVKKQ